MRILFIDFTIHHLFDDAEFPVGGWAVELRNWLVGCRAQGVPAAVISVEGASDAAERSGEARLLRVYARRGRIPGVNYISQFLPNLVREARRFRPDFVVQAVAGPNTGIMWLLSRILRVPFVYRCANDIDVDERYRQRLSRHEAQLYDFGFRRADAYVAQNGYQFAAVRKRFPDKPAILLHNPFQFRDATPPLPRTERGYVAWLGVFQPQKNLPLLLSIAEQLGDIEFRIAGKPETSMNDSATAAALEKLKTLPNVRFVGYLRRREVPAFLQEATMLLSTSHYEGFSNTFLEAWAAGTPMVAPAAVDPDGLIGREGLGRVVERPDDLAGAVRHVTEMPADIYADLSHRCRTHVETEHDPVYLAGQLRDFLSAFGTVR